MEEIFFFPVSFLLLFILFQRRNSYNKSACNYHKIKEKGKREEGWNSKRHKFLYRKDTGSEFVKHWKPAELLCVPQFEQWS